MRQNLRTSLDFWKFKYCLEIDSFFLLILHIQLILLPLYSSFYCATFTTCLYLTFSLEPVMQSMGLDNSHGQLALTADRGWFQCLPLMCVCAHACMCVCQERLRCGLRVKDSVADVIREMKKERSKGSGLHFYSNNPIQLHQEMEWHSFIIICRTFKGKKNFSAQFSVFFLSHRNAHTAL